jgi:putative heme-binding domain-containing protein
MSSILWESRQSQLRAHWAQNFIPFKCYCVAILLTLVTLTQTGHSATVPDELQSTLFSGPDITPSPAVICTAPTGEVFVGVDKQGSLGKKADLGTIVRLVDTDGDGKVDKNTIYATIDNPRGLIAMGDKLIVLHCTQKNGKPHNQQISVYTDANDDGIADGPPQPLITGIGNPNFVQSRGADHCTNNIRLGIDGWIYVAVGDFGFVGAKGTDGKTLTMHGGGVVRLRPDGSELETFIHGTRNVYDIAIDPFMNVFTRENTNDGVGWWIRFSHYIQSGEYGYPSLYTNFPEDMLPALGEYGGGSGTGSLYLQEPQWPAKYNNQALLADWGRSKIYIHKLQTNGASFTNEPIEFISSPQVADLDIDASGRMYIAAWDGAGYSGNPKKGFVDRVVPKDWKYVPFPKLNTQSEAQLIELIKSESITIRTYASQELVSRKSSASSAPLAALAKDPKNSLESRVAAIYTIAQLSNKDALSTLQQLAADPELREHAIRCMADRLEIAKLADTKFLLQSLQDKNPRVQVAAAVALGRTGKTEVAQSLVFSANAPQLTEDKSDPKKKLHSTPNKEIILPHIARQALIALNAEDAVIDGLKSSDTATVNGALATMKWMHSEKVVSALIDKAKTSSGQLQQDIVNVLLRLHQRENDYDGSTWWQTRPDPHGPYYYPIDWAGSEKIASYVTDYINLASDDSKAVTLAEMKRTKAYITPFNPRQSNGGKETKTIGKTAIEDVILYVQKTKGNPQRGAKIIDKVGCVACHNTKPNTPIKGPDLTKLGNMSKDDITAAIIKPEATIAASWVTITMNDGTAYTGTVIKSEKDEIILHDIAGTPAKIDTKKIKNTVPGLNMMSLHLCDSLKLDEFADLIEYIQSMDPNRKK